MKNRALIFAILLMGICNLLSAQSIYLCGNDGENNNNIYRLNADNTITLVISADVSPTLLDIAKSPSGIFYGISLTKLYRIESDGTLTLLNTLPGGTYNSLVCSNDNELYTVNLGNNKLYKYDIAANTVELVFNLGFSTPGDLTFYKGNLIIVDTNTRLKAYNLENNSITTIHCFPSDLIDIYGISSIYNSCDNGEIYFCMFFSGQVYQLDIDTHQITDLALPVTKNWRGMASDNESMFSGCSFQFDSIDCNLSLPENPASQITVFPNPTDGIINIPNSESCDLQFLDIHGRLVKSAENTTQADIGNLASGVYFLKILSGDKITVKKIVKE